MCFVNAVIAVIKVLVTVLPWDGIDFEQTVLLIKHHQSIDSSRKDWERWRSCFDCSVALQSHCGSHRSAHTLFCMKYCLTGISVCIGGGGSSEGELRAETFCQSWKIPSHHYMVLNVTRMEELWTSIYVDLSLMCSDGNIYLHQQKWSLWTGKVFINFPILS